MDILAGFQNTWRDTAESAPTRLLHKTTMLATMESLYPKTASWTPGMHETHSGFRQWVLCWRHSRALRRRRGDIHGIYCSCTIHTLVFRTLYVLSKGWSSDELHQRYVDYTWYTHNSFIECLIETGILLSGNGIALGIQGIILTNLWHMTFPMVSDRNGCSLQTVEHLDALNGSPSCTGE